MGHRSAPRSAGASSGPRVRILFVSHGNACCGPMAEAFANRLGGDILAAQSAGLRPAGRLSTLMRMVMADYRELRDRIEAAVRGLVAQLHEVCRRHKLSA